MSDSIRRLAPASLSATALSQQLIPDGGASISTIWPRPNPAALDPIGAILRTIAQFTGGDELLAMWHEDGEAPRFKTWHAGSMARSEIAAEMIATACRFAVSHARQVHWCCSVNGSHHIMVMRFPVDGGVVSVTVLFMAIDESTRSLDNRGAVCEWPMLVPFFRLWVMHLRAVARADSFASASNLLDLATFHFDERGRLLFGNAAGRALTAARNGLRQSGSSLGANSLAETIALQTAIDDAINVDQSAGDTDRLSCIVGLSRQGCRPLLATVVPIGRDRAIQGGTAAILYVIDPDRELQTRLAPACRVYGLSPVETSLTCMLADGATLADAGKRINLREQTARSYLKQIFAKTGTSRQADLVGLMLKSAMVALPGQGAREPNPTPPIWGGRESPDWGGRFLTDC